MADNSPTRKYPLRCPSCRMPAAFISNGELTFDLKHHGERHTVRISLERVQKLLTIHGGKVVDCAATVKPSL